MNRSAISSASTQLFSAQLASRLLALVGVASLAVPHVSCGAGKAGSTSSSAATGSGAAGAGGAGGGGAGGATGAGGSILTFDAGLPEGGFTPPPLVTDCFDWSPDAGDCPVNPSAVIYLFDEIGCPDGGGLWPSEVISGPDGGTANQCCYVVQEIYCLSGGRPYLVEERARVSVAAPGGAGDGWSEGDRSRWGTPPNPRSRWGTPPNPRPRLDGLTAGERASLAAAWTADALAEHASVASFARFSLALLAAGAPADLVELAHRAALDEVEHARLCFALATAYRGERVAPGPFPVGDRVDVDASLAALAASTVREGCIGETLAAVVAAEQLARATDPAVQKALAQIAADEARHAELSWRTVAWAIQAGGSEVRAAVEQAFAVCAGAEASPDGTGGDGGDAPIPRPAGSATSEAHGRIDAVTTATVIADALRFVVVPSARALLAGRS